MYLRDGISQTFPGTVQLCCLGKLLEEKGFEMWDLGMHMTYKEQMGGKPIER